MNFRDAKTYLLRRLKHELPKNLYYHGIHHTYDVYNAAQEIAKKEGIEEPKLTILLTAALYHDVGFIWDYHNNEPQAVDLIRRVLPDLGYSSDAVDEIASIIMSTKLSIEPTTLLERIMCDADHDYFGREDYHTIADSLAKELAKHGEPMSEKEWVIKQIDFLENRHRFYTESSKADKLPKKKETIAELKLKLQELQ